MEHAQKGQITLSIITCHPDDPSVEHLQSSYLKHVGEGGCEMIVSVGSGSIASAYNRGADGARGAVYIFTHSDVEFMCSRRVIEESMATASAENAGIIGVAGSRVLREDAIWWAQSDQLSGACIHTDKGAFWTTAFGNYGQVVVLDGVFLMMSRRVYEKLGGFDESIPGWDYYDIDITMRAYLAGLVNLTFPIQIMHKSLGDTSRKPGWHKNRAEFVEKWKGKLPISLEGRVLGPPMAPDFGPPSGSES